MESAMKERAKREEDKAIKRRTISIGNVGGGYSYDMLPNTEWWDYKTLIR